MCLLQEEKRAEIKAYRAKTEELKQALKENQATIERLTDAADTSSDDLLTVTLKRQMMKRGLDERRKCAETHFELRGQEMGL